MTVRRSCPTAIQHYLESTQGSPAWCSDDLCAASVELYRHVTAVLGSRCDGAVSLSQPHRADGDASFGIVPFGSLSPESSPIRQSVLHVLPSPLPSPSPSPSMPRALSRRDVALDAVLPLRLSLLCALVCRLVPRGVQWLAAQPALARSVTTLLTDVLPTLVRFISNGMGVAADDNTFLLRVAGSEGARAVGTGGVGVGVGGAGGGGSGGSGGGDGGSGAFGVGDSGTVAACVCGGDGGSCTCRIGCGTGSDGDLVVPKSWLCARDGSDTDHVQLTPPPQSIWIDVLRIASAVRRDVRWGVAIARRGGRGGRAAPTAPLLLDRPAEGDNGGGGVGCAPDSSRPAVNSSVASEFTWRVFETLVSQAGRLYDVAMCGGSGDGDVGDILAVAATGAGSRAGGGGVGSGGAVQYQWGNDIGTGALDDRDGDGDGDVDAVVDGGSVSRAPRTSGGATLGLQPRGPQTNSPSVFLSSAQPNLSASADVSVLDLGLGAAGNCV